MWEDEEQKNDKGHLCLFKNMKKFKKKNPRKCIL